MLTHELLHALLLPNPKTPAGCFGVTRAPPEGLKLLLVELVRAREVVSFVQQDHLVGVWVCLPGIEPNLAKAPRITKPLLGAAVTGRDPTSLATPDGNAMPTAKVFKPRAQDQENKRHLQRSNLTADSI